MPAQHRPPTLAKVMFAARQCADFAERAVWIEELAEALSEVMPLAKRLDSVLLRGLRISRPHKVKIALAWSEL